MTEVSGETKPLVSEALKLAQVVDEDVINRVVPKSSVAYYRERFRLLIEASGYGDKPLAEISRRQLFGALSGVPLRARLPWRDATLFNWAAFLGGVIWLAWRRPAGTWWILSILGILIALSVAV
jgi:hypothetical protein